MKKFQNKYRIPSARLQNWDYGSNGAYFITICTHKMQPFFGHISNNEMHLNALGQIAHNTWESIPNQFPYIELGNFTVMPNHMHGILIINKLNIPIPVETRFIASNNDENNKNGNAIFDDNRNAETRLNASLQEKGGFAGEMNPMLQENISRIIRWYKGRCSFEMRKIHADFNWHSRFHDHIIRDSKSFENIQNYIANNPSEWNEDKFNTK